MLRVLGFRRTGGATRWRQPTFDESYSSNVGIRQASVLLLKRISRQVRVSDWVNLFNPIDRPEICLHADDSMVVDDIFWYGVKGYEGRLPEIWEMLARQAKSIVEIGGNIGLYSTVGGLAAPGSYRVFEPHQVVAKPLRRNLKLNKLDHIEVVEAAVDGQAS
jgi:hypothetical protein